MYILLIAILPVYLLCLFVYSRDRDKESKKLLTKLFVLGMLSCIPIFFLELFVGNFFGPEENMNLITLFIYVFIGVALIEEGFKWLVVKTVAFDDKEFDHVYDGIVYAVFVSLGFAVLENVLYVFAKGVGTGLLRAISSVPAHACNAIIMGEYIGLAKIASINGNKNVKNKNIVLSILVPTLTHAIYDYCIFTGELLYLVIFVIFLIVFYVYSFKKVKKISSVEKNFIDRSL